MIYLSGAIQPELMRQPDMGFMLQPGMGNRPNLSETLWAADNGCYAAGDRFDYNGWLRWLAEFSTYNATCLFAVAPDVVGNAEETIARSMPALHDIRQLGYRPALVAQDGLENLHVPWDEFDVLFVGGTTEWKLSEHAYRLVQEADARGKWTHMGRVNSWRRLKAAAISGYDSADGTYIAFAPDKLLPRVQAWLATLRRTPHMEATG